MLTNAQYVNERVIRIERGEETLYVPTDPANSDYAAIMALVESGELTIAPAE